MCHHDFQIIFVGSTGFQKFSLNFTGYTGFHAFSLVSVGVHWLWVVSICSFDFRFFRLCSNCKYMVISSVIRVQRFSFGGQFFLLIFTYVYVLSLAFNCFHKISFVFICLHLLVCVWPWPWHAPRALSRKTLKRNFLEKSGMQHTKEQKLIHKHGNHNLRLKQAG